MFGLVVLIIGFVIAWLGGHGYLPLEPQFVVGATLILFTVVFCLAVTTMMAGTSFIARQKYSTLPDSPEDGILSRVIRDSESGAEAIVHVHPNSSICEVLESNWPFKKKKSSDWYVVDKNTNDVTNWPVSNWDGTATVRYRD
jgi:hypothetical protein